MGHVATISIEISDLMWEVITLSIIYKLSFMSTDRFDSHHKWVTHILVKAILVILCTIGLRYIKYNLNDDKPILADGMTVTWGLS